MKKMSMVYVISLCFLMPSFASEQPSFESYMEYLETVGKGEFERLKSEYKDMTNLRTYFEDGLLRSPISDKEMLMFKQKFGVSDEIMLTVLTGIIRETAMKTEWEWGKSREDSYDVNWRLLNAVRWLGVCADIKTKQFLMDVATDSEKLFDFRAYAIQAYMRRADAKEIRDAIARLLADDMRLVKNGINSVAYSVYTYAILAYDEAEGNTHKREAIIDSLTTVPLEKEEEKKTFVQADKWLAERSKEYAESPQRKALLERVNKPPEKETP